MTRIYGDAYLNHWADVYVQRRVKRFGITLDQFLAQPEQMLNRVARFEAAEHAQQEPTMHRQERRQDALLRQRGEQLMVKRWKGSRHGLHRDKPHPNLVR